MEDMTIRRTGRIRVILEALRKRNILMGILNVTPDSFYDGGRQLAPELAIQHGLTLISEGADILDIGGESTRPGSERISAEVQMARILPVIQGLRAVNNQIALSVDTTNLETAQAALASGADIINDISALRDSPQIARLAADEGAALILMHMRGTPQTMQSNTHYENILMEISDFLRDTANLALSGGVPGERTWLDPGIGFGKSVDGNLEILRNLDHFAQLGHPLVIGVSRKSFIGNILGLTPAERLNGTIAASAYIAGKGIRMIHRAHDVREMRECLKMIEAIGK